MISHATKNFLSSDVVFFLLLCFLHDFLSQFFESHQCPRPPTLHVCTASSLSFLAVDMLCLFLCCQVATWDYTPGFFPHSCVRRREGFSRLARSREINLTVPSGVCPGLFMLAECTHSFVLGSVPLLLLLVFFCIPVHIWLRPTTLTLCAPASVVWVHVGMSVYVE